MVSQLIVCGLGVLLSAAEPDGPKGAPLAGPEQTPARIKRSERPRPDRPGRLGEREEAEWKDAEEFFKTNSPNRWSRLAQVSEERMPMLRNMILARYRSIEWLNSPEDKDLYDVKVSQVRLDDEIFGLVQQLKGASSESRQSLETQLRAKVAASVDLRLQERQMRLDRAEKLLAAEKERLKAAEADKKALIERGMEQAKKGRWEVPEGRDAGKDGREGRPGRERDGERPTTRPHGG